MESSKKCSNKKHKEINAISYCTECNLYLCNKCQNIHIEYLDAHNIQNLDRNNPELFSGICKELNHKNELIFYCKNHNQLCCAACICKIKKRGNGQHSECNVCDIDEIKEEKKNKLKEKISYLEESSKNIEDSIKKLKEIYEKISESKEEIKLKISKIFTRIRSIVNEREDQLLFELDNIYEKTFFKEDIIKKGEKLTYQIKTFFDKGKFLDKEWNDDNQLINRINDCIDIENKIKNIVEINENIEKCNSKKISIKFSPQDEQTIGIEEKIKNFGEIIDEEKNIFKFIFNPGNNYNISNNGLVATKNSGEIHLTV